MTKLERLKAELDDLYTLRRTIREFGESINLKCKKVENDMRPLTQAEHRKQIRGALGAYVVKNYAGEALPKYGDHVKILNCTRQRVVIDYLKGAWMVPYSALQIEKPSDEQIRINNLTRMWVAL